MNGTTIVRILLSDMSLAVRRTIKDALAGFAPPPVPQAPPPIPAPRAEVPPPPPALDPNATQSTDLLKIQMEQETMSNLSVAQVTEWIEQGRVQEYHMVARQFSEHWIEAIKVPALRPVFERKRRELSGKPRELPVPPPDIAPVKKSLFGGLFGRN